MGRYYSFPLLLLAAILQATVVPAFRIGGAGADVLLLVVVSWTLRAGIREGVLWAILGGMLHDLISARPMGMASLALVLVAFGVNLIVGEIGQGTPAGNVLLPPVASAGATLVFHAVMVALLNVIGLSVPILYALANIALVAALYNAGLSLPIHWLTGRIFRTIRTRGLGM